MSEPDLLIEGERVALGPLRADLAETYGRWVNQPDVRFGVEYLAVATPESSKEWVEETNKAAAEREPKAVTFTIYDLSDRTPVGTVGLFDISLDGAFHVLGLQNVLLETLAWNEAAIRAYEKAGFRRVGVRRQAAMSRGARADVVLMDAIPADFGPSALAP